MRQIIITTVACLLFYISYAQDSLSTKHLKPFTYTFNVIDGKLSGEGEAFLKQQMAKAQYTMLGEYHGSKRISEFTNAIIPILDSLNYKAMALEVGPTIGKVLNRLEGDIENEIKHIHEKYLTRDSDGYINIPFPFFDSKEDVRFLKNAKDNSWNIFGIDQEYYDSYIMLVDIMFNNLSEDLKKQHKDLYSRMRSELKQFYKNDQSDKENLHRALSKSKLFKEFLKEMGSEANNIEVIDALKKSSAIYMLYNKRQWYENNATRIKYMKSQLKKGLDNLDFNIEKDKLLIKMGGYHLSKGFSPLGVYEVGNTLNELAEFYGNTTLNIGFKTRFHMEDGQLQDNSISENIYYKNHKPIIEMGKENQWVVIDLRPLIKGYHYYPIRFNLNEQLAKLVERYDLIVIPKVEVEGTLIYD
ncbi:hypothetical protein [Winogradskyella sp. PG-2]|uniref:hypothetical protein n=1 Tax=Winogradskyella sp. PG-2 TaxID=754409 RepID=UPI000458821D|nr:hypothetical protein [Winogradskyella sp. PG-2]BAO77690.1 hypothetical protein WPG_3460 [Winogradskyella sp. PG-2]